MRDTSTHAISCRLARRARVGPSWYSPYPLPATEGMQILLGRSGLASPTALAGRSASRDIRGHFVPLPRYLRDCCDRRLLHWRLPCFCCFLFPDRPADFTGRRQAHQLLPFVFVPGASHSSRQAPLRVASQRGQDSQTFLIVKERDGSCPGQQKYNGSHKIDQYPSYENRSI